MLYPKLDGSPLVAGLVTCVAWIFRKDVIRAWRWFGTICARNMCQAHVSTVYYYVQEAFT